MTRILVVADSHGAEMRLCQILREEQVDALIYLGDGLSDLEAAEATGAVRHGLRVYRVRGNCDYAFPFEPPMGLASFDGVLIFYTHGHMFGVKSSTGQLAETAEARGADLALYGHTHRARLEYENSTRTPTLFNPGSLGRGGSYGIVECNDGSFTCQIKDALPPPEA